MLLKSTLKVIEDEKEAIFIGHFTKQFEAITLSYQSVILLTMTQTEKLFGVIIVMHSDAYHFTFDQFKLMISFVQHVTLAVDANHY